MTLAEVKLDDKYALLDGRVFLTGIQALVRLPLAQRRRDQAAGLNTAGYISGYRGSPLGALDQQLVRARPFLDQHRVKFNPGVNEDLAATAIWGTQQAELGGDGAYDGVFAMWYGKGPGVDRSGDALRHANLAGASQFGGVLALLGDDHTCESSTTAHQSELAMVDAMIPVLNPAGVQDILDFGLYGFALSRYSGCWVALKCVHDTVESGASVDVDSARAVAVLPQEHVRPQDGLNIRWPDTPLEQEARLHDHKLAAAQAFVRANGLDRVVMDSAKASLGIITTGKSYLDVRQALEDLGVAGEAAARLGLRLYKVGMPWPLEPEGARRFCRGLERVIVVEEKRALIETQLKELMYGLPDAPAIIGKCDESGAPLFRSAGRLDSNRIAHVIGRRVVSGTADTGVSEQVARLERLLQTPPPELAPMVRTPYFCPGCPHSSSTRVPEGSRALAGIGCHYLAQFMDRDTERFTQMGGEGASWVGESVFSKRAHMFQNVGDGTYFHSGLLAIRAAVAANTNVTFKILYNDAVAMTGGQALDGGLSVADITQQMCGEGVERIAVVTDEPHKYGPRAGFAAGVNVYHRDALDQVQRELREVEGTTVLVYDQTCAAEKRRRRKRGLYPDPPQRVFINDAVCEGCGDCGITSNCVAVLPLETELGRKRTIDQSACNKDFSCLKGFCPSFVTVHGAAPRRGGERLERDADASDLPALPDPVPPALDRPYGVVVTGVGGTGVVTIGAIIGMAAHLEGKGCSVLDMMGLAQKGGAVVSHVRIAKRPADITATRIANGAADLLLGGDLVVSASRDALATAQKDVTRVVVNTHQVMTGDFTRSADLAFPGRDLRRTIEAAAEHTVFVEATRLATALMGDSIASNLFMLGFAYQRGALPLSAQAVERAIELNGVAVAMNQDAFTWGRRAAHTPALVERVVAPVASVSVAGPTQASLDEVIDSRAAQLVAYQDEAYAARYREFVRRVRSVEATRAPGRTTLTQAVARYYAKLLAYKDEYEVARLYTDGAFIDKLQRQFEGGFRLEFHLAPPLLSGRDPHTGEPRKRRYGGWMFGVLRRLAQLKRLRGTPFDMFGYTAERRRERGLIAEYETVIDELLAALERDNHALAVDIARLPEHVRGFGHVKARHIAQVKERERELLAAFRASGVPKAAA